MTVLKHSFKRCFTKTEYVDGRGRILTLENISELRERDLLSRINETHSTSEQPIVATFNSNSNPLNPFCNIVTSTPNSRV